MKLLSVKIEKRENGIVFPSLDALKSALAGYEDGSAFHRTAGSIPGMGGALFAFYGARKDDNAFMKDMFARIDAGIKENDRAYLSYDYDGGRAFHKTSVGVEKLASNAFKLSIYAAYVGDKPEIRLAENLKMERALSEVLVQMEFEPEGKNFFFDFEPIITKLTGIEGIKGVSLKSLNAEEIAKAIMESAVNDDTSRAVLFKSPELEIILSIKHHSVSCVSEYKGRNKTIVWQLKAATISGPLHEDYEDKTKFLAPILVIDITNGKPATKSGYTRPAPAYTDANKAWLLSVGKAIELALS